MASLMRIIKQTMLLNHLNRTNSINNSNKNWNRSSSRNSIIKVKRENDHRTDGADPFKAEHGKPGSDWY
jgi:hypothetical protein